MKKVSIITINLNNKEGLIKTAKSVVSQTSFSDVEWIVIDGGSSDGSLEVISEYQKKMTYCVSEPDRGIYNAMNKGIRQAHGEYVLFLNSGDYFHNQNVIHEFVNSSDFGLFDYCIGGMATEKDGDLDKVYWPAQQLTAYFLITSWLPHPSTFTKRRRFKDAGYDESYRIVSDILFISKDIILNAASYTALGYVVSVFNMEGISSTSPHIVQDERRRMIREVLPLACYPDYINLLHTNYELYDKKKDSALLTILSKVYQCRLLFCIFTAVNWTVYLPIAVYRIVKRFICHIFSLYNHFYRH